MNKIPTLFVRDWASQPPYVLPDVTPGCEWVLAGEGVATRKYDGTCVMFDGDLWWARREVKDAVVPPVGWQKIGHDPETGKSVGWEPIEQSAFAKYHAEVLAAFPSTDWPAGTYELIGPKINGNPEGLDQHLLQAHAWAATFDLPDRSFVALQTWLLALPKYEGIVFHHEDGRMAKIKRRDLRGSAR